MQQDCNNYPSSSTSTKPLDAIKQQCNCSISLNKFARTRELGTIKPLYQRTLIDYRIQTLESSWRHAIPLTARTSAGVSAMAFDNAENRFLLCGNARGEISIIDFESSTNQNPGVETYPLYHRVIQTRSKSKHEFMVNGCQWYPVDTSVFVTTGMDKLLKIWDATQLVSVEDYKFVQPISNFHWSVSNTNALSLVALALSTSNISFLDPRTGNTTQQIRAQNQRIWSVRWLNTANNYILASGSDQGMITLWDIRSGKNELVKVRSPGGIEKLINENGKRQLPTERRSLAHANRICSIQCSSDGRFLVSLTHDRVISLWEARTLRLLSWMQITESNSAQTTVPIKIEICDEGRSIWAFVPNGNDIPLVQFPHPIRADGKRIKLASPIRSLKGHFQRVIACAYRKTHHQLITSSTDRNTLVWAPKMDECHFDVMAKNIQHLHEDAFSDED